MRWSGAALCAIKTAADTGEEEDANPYDKIDETPENDDKGVEACVKSSLNMAAVEGWSTIVAREIDAMCHYLVFDHRSAYAFDDGTRKGMAGHGLDWQDSAVREGAQKLLLDSEKTRVLPDAWKQVRSYPLAPQPTQL